MTFFLQIKVRLVKCNHYVMMQVFVLHEKEFSLVSLDKSTILSGCFHQNLKKHVRTFYTFDWPLFQTLMLLPPYYIHGGHIICIYLLGGHLKNVQFEIETRETSRVTPKDCL